jgi:hypothetical protein
MATRSTTLDHLTHNFHLQRGLIFGAIIMTALFAFEAFNYGTTHYALSDLLGDLSFAGLQWATILAIAFCGIDFAGIARLFAPETGRGRNDSWYLFGAWMLAATMNAMLTWWGVSLAILNHQSNGTAVIEREALLRIVPVFVAIMVWLIRILMIGTFSISGDRLFASNNDRARSTQRLSPPAQTAAPRPVNYNNLPATNSARINAAPASAASPSAVNPSTAKSAAPTASRARTFTSPPRSYIPPPEPVFPDQDELTITEPAYVSTPLAAKPTHQPPVQGGNQRPTTRAPFSSRRF